MPFILPPPIAVDNVTLTQSGAGVVSVKNGGIGTTQLADLAVTNAKVAAAAAIAKTKLAALDIVNADVNAAAAIAASKISGVLTTQLMPTRLPTNAASIGQGINASSTRYVPVNGGMVSVDATEANQQTQVLKAMTVTKIRVQFGAYDRANGTFTLRKNGAGTAITGTVTGAGTFEATGSVSFAAGDLWDVEVVTGAGGASSNLNQVEVEAA